MRRFFEILVFTRHRGFLNVMYQRQYIDSAQRFSDALRLPSDHVETFDLLDELTHDPELILPMMLQSDSQHAPRARSTYSGSY